MKRHTSLLILIVCLAVLVVGLIRLMALRFESGDVYPEYSSLRSDPLGTMVLYESLGTLEGFTVTRDLSATGQLPNPSGATYLHLATTDRAWERVPPKTVEDVEQFVRRGARLVITMYPLSSRTTTPPGTSPTTPKPEDEDPRESPVSLWTEWGLTPSVLNLSLGAGGAFEPAEVSNQSALPLPETLAWHSGLVFEKFDEGWAPIYSRDGNPVVVERRFGAGSVVIATDSYFLSNEALQNDRHADLLAWMLGRNSIVVFDEAHLGVTETPGVAALMQRYRLRWFLAALILLAGLFVWRNSTSFAPGRVTEAGEAYIAGRDASSGFVNLLRRNIAIQDILATCFMEWKKTASSGRYSTVRLQQAEAAFASENSKPAKEKDPVAAYRAIAGILHKRET
jgi:hypothetical protein